LDSHLAIQSIYPTSAASVILDDSADTQTGKQVTFNTVSSVWEVTGLPPQVIELTLSTGSNVQVLGGSPAAGQSGGNTYAVQSVPAGVSLTLTGGTGTDTLHGPDTANTWQITGANAGTLNQTVTFASIPNLTGGAANDTFQYQTGGSLSGSLDGGGGTNTLDYTGYQGDILVDLLLHTASLVGQGVANVANVSGSQGNDLIVGDGNANVLVGGTGRNVILGHGGGDTIRGGGGFNLLVSDLTFYDDKLPYLRDLMQYWDNPSMTSLDDLVNPLKSKNGFTAPDGLVLVFNRTTVTPDNVLDHVTGGSGPNWFIVDRQDVSSIINGQGGPAPLPSDRLTVI
jgi:Ca2+-binding RTX toxin-like protein